MRRFYLPFVYLWTLPTTSVGLLVTLLALLTGGRTRLIQGVLETHGGFATFVLTRLTPLPGGATAMTLGHVVIGRNPQALNATRAHERIHVQQCQRWGPLFYPAYFLGALYGKLKHKDAYHGNPFEKEAFDKTP